MAGFVNRENRVPQWQKLFQTNDGLRQWQKGPRAKMILYPFHAMLWTGFAGSMYMMCRMVLGHKTWFGSD